MKIGSTQFVMSYAHALTRETLVACPSADYRATLSEALRIAWSQTANGPRAEWNSLTEAEQIKTIQRLTVYCIRRDIAETTKRGKSMPNYFSWVRCADDVLTVVNEAFCEIGHQMDLAERREIVTPLSWVVADTVREAARKIARHERKHARPLKHDHAGLAYIVDRAAPLAEHTPSPEVACIVMDTIREACGDDMDVDICMWTACGYTMRETAERIGKSAMYVSRHLAKVRERHAEEK